MSLGRVAIILLLGGLATVGCFPDPAQFEEKLDSPDTGPAVQVDASAPVAGFQIVSVQPNSGPPKGLQLVEIRGGGFKEGARVLFGGSDALDVTVTSAGLIYVLTPPYVPATIDVTVVNPDETQTEKNAAYSYVNSIEVSALDPAIGPITGGMPVQLTGTGLAGTETVLFEGRAALDVQVINDTSVLAIVPAGVRTGAVHVHVVTRTQTAKLANAFSYFENPKIHGMSPLYSSVQGGGTLVLTGVGLIEQSVISIGGREAQLLATSKDDSRLVARIPPNQAGRYDLKVSTTYGQVELAEAFVYTDSQATELVNVWPRSGSALGGDEVALAVTGFESPAGLVVRFGQEPATLSSVDTEQGLIWVRSPPGVSGDVVDITVTLGEMTTRLRDAWRWTPSIAVSAVTPRTGSQTGGTLVKVTGRGLGTAGLEASLGALPVRDLRVVSDEILTFEAPPGSPGLAALRLETTWASVELEDAYTYTLGEPVLWAIEPSAGAVAGNTYVTAYGADLPESAVAYFGDSQAIDTQRLAPNILAFRAPPAEGIGSVNVRIEAPGFQATLDGGYTYFDPKGLFGGTWGEPIDRSVNVTVLTSGSDDPVEGALVVLGSEDVPRFLGYTNARGQITLSDYGLRGRQTVTAAKAELGASTVVSFDAENVTLFLPDQVQPGGPDDGNVLYPGRIAGQLDVPGKYVILPPWQCDETPDPHDGLCAPCYSDAGCGELAPHCVRTTNQPPFCTAGCDGDSDCLAPGEAADGTQNFVCSSLVTAEGGRCIPNPGTAEARCFVSSASVLGSLEQPDPLAVLQLNSPERTFMIENARLGEVAVYCLAGGVRLVDGVELFEPIAMGLSRYVNVIPGAELPENTVPTEVSVVIDIPLDRSVNVVFGPQPLTPLGPHSTELRATMNLGSDGYVPFRSITVPPEAQEFSFRGLPRDLSGELQNATYAFHASASSSPDLLPTSDVLRQEIDTLGEGRWLSGMNGAWTWRSDGYPGDVSDVEVVDSERAFATTRDGQILSWFGGQWTSQPVTAGEALHSIAIDHAGGLIAVGERGRVVRWDGVAWQREETGFEHTLRGVTSLGPDHAIAVGDYVIAESSAETWSIMPFGPPKELNAVSAVPQANAWAVGRHGVVLRRASDDGIWAAVSVPAYNDLNAVWSTSDGDVVAVGDDGLIVRRQPNGDWVRDNLQTRRNLHAVYGRARDEIWAAGDASIILRFDGQDWRELAVSDNALSLRGISGTSSGDALFALGVHAVHLDPFLTIPRFIEPRTGSMWSGRRIHWTDAGGNPSFLSLRIYAATGNLAWSVMTPAFASDFALPDIGAYEPGVLPPGPKRLYAYEIEHVDFDIDRFDNRVFRIADWNAWVQATFIFDNPGASIPLQ